MKLIRRGTTQPASLPLIIDLLRKREPSTFEVFDTLSLFLFCQMNAKGNPFPKAELIALKVSSN